MGAIRKLQAEIDKTLKKVEEGLEEFDGFWEQVYQFTAQYRIYYS